MKRRKMPQIPAGWVPLTDDLPQRLKGFDHTSVDVELLLRDGKVVPGVVYDDGEEVTCYEYRHPNGYRKRAAIAWRSIEEEPNGRL